MTKDFKARLKELEIEYREDGPYELTKYFLSSPMAPIPNTLKPLLLFILTGDNHETIDKKGNVVGFYTQRRTFHDIFLICLNYLEEISLEEVVRALYELKKEDLIGKFRCGGLEKRVWMSKVKWQFDHNYSGNSKEDENGMTNEDFFNEMETVEIAPQESEIIN